MRADLLLAAVAIGLAAFVTSGLWTDLGRRSLAASTSDQTFFEWLLAYGPYALTHGQDPLFADLLNVPYGVNLGMNTSITVIAILFAPVTWLFGATAAYVTVLTGNLAASAFAWYWVLSRHLVRSRLAAAVGGLLAGFAPGLVSHANGHLNWTAGWLVPLIVWQVLRLRQPGRWLRNGVVLGLLVAAGFSIAAEALFFTAIACGIFLGTWAPSRAVRAEARAALPPLLRGLAVTAVTSAALLAYPLWLHFAGPQRFHGTGYDAVIHAEDLAGYAAYPIRSLAGVLGLDTELAANPTEENSFLGAGLLVLAVVCFVTLWRRADPGRRATLRALAVTGGVFAVLSLGPKLKIMGTVTEIPLPYALLDDVPLFDAALPSRLALAVAPIFAVLLALTVDRLTGRRPAVDTGANAPAPDVDAPATDVPATAGGGRSRAVTTAWIAGFAAALLPLTPMPLLTVDRQPVPAFITSGAWRDHVSPGGVLVPVPLTLDITPDAQRWQAYALAHRQGEFRLPSGYFLGPGGPDGRGRIGPLPRFTDGLLLEVARTGKVPPIGAAERAGVRADLDYWNAEAVVLADHVFGTAWPVRQDALLELMTELLGPPERVEDVWLWQPTDD
ncbi:DUF2079 domain-containing protein [Polymorphospora sp. NPDC050346]|uniref:DUF2079 domain-containing protein n=1 Tax=Polymorphospora sp. NPDC050346 TaxID=3155780 RepID=UPI0033D226E6